jgi:hypothetical protein
MIIKRWTGAWTEEYPKTTTAHIYTANGLTQIFSANKILPAYLPDSVFDSLFYYGTTTGNVGSAPTRLVLAEQLIAAKNAAASAGRGLKGYYFVITATGTITGLTGIQDTITSNEYATLEFRPQDGGTSGTANTSSGVLEAGDWFVIENITGSGTVGAPWIFTASVINNSFELASTSIDGIVRLSSRTTYASLSGDNAITESVLKTVIDNAAFASGTHIHGNITNGGQITSTVVTPADTDAILIGDASNSGKIERGITIGTGTSTFLRNDGTWGTPVGTTYSAATTTTLGLVETSFAALGSAPTVTETTTAGRYYGVSLNSNQQMVVNVPWTDTTYSQATDSALGLIKLGSATQQSVAANAVTATASRSYALQVNASGQGLINVPWTDTTYSAGEGMTLTSTTFRMQYPLYVSITTPTTSVTSAIWYDIN